MQNKNKKVLVHLYRALLVSPKMSKAVGVKDALRAWEERNEGANPLKAEDIQLQGNYPPIEKMDVSLAALTNARYHYPEICALLFPSANYIFCSFRKISLSSNMIDRISNLAGLSNLKILSLSRNNIKSLSGIEVLGDSLEELWISYNNIDKLKGIEAMKKLKIFYIGNNSVKDWAEFTKMNGCSSLEDLLFLGNPLQENLDEEVYKREVQKKLPRLKKLDGDAIVGLDD